MKPCLLFTLCLLGATSLRAQTPVNPTYIATDLGTLGGTESIAYGINDAGQIVGYSYTTGNSAQHATLFSPGGTPTDLGTLGGSYSSAYAINDAGQIVGTSATTGNSAQHATLFNPSGTPTDLGTLGGSSSAAYAINDAGQIVGYSFLTGNSNVHATRFTPGGSPTDLGTLGGSSSIAYGINDVGQIVGLSDLTGNSVSHAALFNPGSTPADLGTLGGSFSEAHGINDAGQIVGLSNTSGNSVFHAARFNSDGPPTDLGTLGGTSSFAYAINDAGQIVGSSYTIGNNFFHGFLYSGGVMSDVNNLIQPGSGVTNISMNDFGNSINDWGQIVAHGIVSGQTHAVLLNPVDPLTSVSGTGRNTKFVSGMGYDKFTATTNPGDLGTTVDLLGGTTGSGGSVAGADGGFGLNRDVEVTFTGADNSGLASDIVNIEGTFSDWIVLSLTYDESLFGDDVALGWFDSDSGEWTLAVNGNTGEDNTPTFIDGAYDADFDFHLGYYGVDAATHTVWAVVNHNSDFAAVQAVPEPGTCALVGVGLAALLLRRRCAA